MSVENLFAAMLCFMSTCDNNLNKMQINSVYSKPLEDVWGLSCRTEALSFNEKVSELVNLQQTNDQLFKEIEDDLESLKSFVGISPNVVNGRQKRETVDTFVILIHPQFDCKIFVNGVKITNAEVIPTIVQCESKQFGQGWILFATINADHRKYLNEKSTNELINGFGGFTYGEKVNEYFLGLQRLHEITAESGDHELLILTHNADYWEKTHTHFMRYKRFSVAGANNDYRLKSLDGYDGDINDSLQAFLGEPFSLVMLSVEQWGAVTMFVRSVNV